MKPLLIELGTEELPVKALPGLAQAFFDGVVAGLGLVRDLVVVPHADAARWDRVIDEYAAMLPPGLGLLGIGERTAVIMVPGESWRVVGEHEVRWLAPGASQPVVARHGERIGPTPR